MKSLSIALSLATASSITWAGDAAPHCNTARECELMWAAAQDAIGLVSNMRNRIVTDSRIETYGPTTYGRVGAVIAKVPSGSAGYDFRIQIECYRSVDCTEVRALGTTLFITHVNSALIGVRPVGEMEQLLGQAQQQPPVKPWAPQKIGTGNLSPIQRVEALDEARACNTKPSAMLIGQRPGQSTFTLACSNGDALAVGCDDTSCRVLK